MLEVLHDLRLPQTANILTRLEHALLHEELLDVHQSGLQHRAEHLALHVLPLFTDLDRDRSDKPKREKLLSELWRERGLLEFRDHARIERRIEEQLRLAVEEGGFSVRVEAIPANLEGFADGTDLERFLGDFCLEEFREELVRFFLCEELLEQLLEREHDFVKDDVGDEVVRVEIHMALRKSAEIAEELLGLGGAELRFNIAHALD